MHYQPQDDGQLSGREFHIDPTKWQYIKLFFMNTIEISLIIVSLFLAVFKDDITSLTFEMLTLIILYLSMKDMGKNVPLQRKIIIGAFTIMLAILCTKWFLIDYYQKSINDIYAEWHGYFISFGFVFYQQKNVTDQNQITYSFNEWKSV